MERARDEEQLLLKNFPWIRNGFGTKIQRTCAAHLHVTVREYE